MKEIPALAQGVYFLITGIWPLLHMKSFLTITGPKRDLWLVKTVGVLVTVIGAVLTFAGLRRRTGPEMALLAAGSALALTAIDVTYVARKRISPLYLAEAAVELGFIGLWALSLRRSRPAADLPYQEGGEGI